MFFTPFHDSNRLCRQWLVSPLKCVKKLFHAERRQAQLTTMELQPEAYTAVQEDNSVVSSCAQLFLLVSTFVDVSGFVHNLFLIIINLETTLLLILDLDPTHLIIRVLLITLLLVLNPVLIYLFVSCFCALLCLFWSSYIRKNPSTTARA